MSRRTLRQRVPEPEVMDDAEEVRGYAESDFRRVNSAFARRLARAVEGRAAGRAIDLGTGPAEIPVLLARRLPRWQLTAVDASAPMLKLARARVRQEGLEQRIELRRGNVCRLGARRGKYDLVFSNSLLHHLADPLPFWREAPRLLRPGGIMVIMDLRRPTTRARARHLVRRHAAAATPLLRRLLHQSLLAAFTPAEVRQQIAAVAIEGLSVQATTDRHLVVSGCPRLPRPLHEHPIDSPQTKQR